VRVCRCDATLNFPQSGDPPAQHHCLEHWIEQRERQHRPADAQGSENERRGNPRGFHAAHQIAAASLERAPVDLTSRNEHTEHERYDHDEPQQDAPKEKSHTRSDEVALQIAIISIVQLEALEACLREWIGEPERHPDHRPPEDRTDRIAPSRTGLMEADAAIDRAGEPVTARAIDRELPEQREHDQREQSGYLTEPAASECG